MTDHGEQPWLDAAKWAESVEDHDDDCMCPSCVAVSRARMEELDG